MSVRYTEFHPRWHRQPMSVWWWLRRRSYLAFVVRELSSLFVAWFVVYLLVLVNAVADGPAAYQRFLDWSDSPWVVALNVVALAFVVFHSVTWLNLAPQAIVVRARGRRVPARWVALAHFLAWAAVSVVLFWVIEGLT